MSEKYLYILMRNDLGSLGPGRAAAQASHAANAFIHKHGNTKDAKAWTASTPQGFGTAIVLSATLPQIVECRKNLTGQNVPNDTIIDPDYAITFSAELLPYINAELANDGRTTKIEQSTTDPKKYILHRQEITCAYIFGNKDELAPILGELPLYS
jgi:peptidyl-tRNA hydrolase